MRKKLPIGIQTFQDIRNENYCYVDKTDIAYKLIDQGRYYFLSRPRRFGKSLFLSTLRAIFEGKKELFKGLFIYDKWDFEITFPVIAIDFGKGEFKSKEEIYDALFKKVSENAIRLGVKIPELKSLSFSLGDLIQAVQEKYNQKVVVLIDEYDKPIIDNIANREMALVGREALSSFYSAIKSSDEDLKFVFMTGVSKFSKMNLFSTLNNLNDITIQKQYGTITGYTHEDVKIVFKDYLDGVDLEKVKKWYNGYNYFAGPIYNPFDVLQFLGNDNEFKNYWWKSGNPTFLIEILKKSNFNIPDFNGIVVGEEILDRFDVDKIDIVALLWQTGYLTFDKKVDMMGETQYQMKIPNLEIAKSLNALFLDYLLDYDTTKTTKQQSLYKAILACDFEKFEVGLNSLFASISHHNFTNNTLSSSEGFYGSVIYTMLYSIGFDIVAEDVTSVGRIDLTLKTPTAVIVMEFKVNQKEKAMEQIKSRRYFDKYRDDERPLYIMGINLDSETRCIADFEWEKL